MKPDLASLGDLELLALFRRDGSQEAYALIVARHYGMVLRTCQRLLDNRQDAEDAAQAAFVALVRRADTINAGFAGWLHKTAHDEAVQLLRSRTRRARRERVAAAQRPAEAAPTSSELREELDAALERLPEPMREAVVLRYLEGRDQEEAAQIAGCPRGTLSRRASDGLERLRGIMARRGSVLASVLTMLLAEEARASTVSAPPVLLEAARSAAAQPVATSGLAAGRFLLNARSRKWTVAVTLAGVLAAFAVWQLSSKAPGFSHWATMKEHKSIVLALRFDASGQLASVSDDRTAIAWDVKGKKAQSSHTMKWAAPAGHDRPAMAAAFSPDAELVALNGPGNLFRLWNVKDRAEALNLPLSGLPLRACFSSTGRRQVVVYDGRLLLLNLAGRGGQTIDVKDAILPVAWSPDERWLVAVDLSKVHLVDPDTRQVKQTLPHKLHVPQWAAFSPDGSRLAVLDWHGTIETWEVNGWKKGPTFRFPGASAWSMTYSADGKWIALASQHAYVVLWNVATGERVLLRSPTSLAGVRCLAFSPNGEYLAAGREDGGIDVWRADGGGK